MMNRLACCIFTILAASVGALQLFGQSVSKTVNLPGDVTLTLSKVADLRLSSGLIFRKGCSPACYSEGELVAYPFRGGIQVTDTNDGRVTLLKTGDNKTYVNINISRNGKYVEAAGHGRVLVWELASGRIVSSIKARPYQDESALSPTGNALFYHEPPGFVGKINDSYGSYSLLYPMSVKDSYSLEPQVVKDQYPLFRSGNLSPGGGAFSPTDEDLLAVQYRWRIYLWNYKSRTVVRKFIDADHDQRIDREFAHGNIDNIGFSNDGSLLFSQGGGHIRIWDVRNGMLLHDLVIGGKVWGITTISKDNRFVASSDDDGIVCVYEIRSGKLLMRVGNGNYRPYFSDPKVGLVSVESGDIFDLETGGRVDGVKGEFLADGKLLLKNSDGSLSAWRVSRKKASGRPN